MVSYIYELAASLTHRDSNRLRLHLLTMRTILLFLLLPTLTFAQTPDWAWAKSAGTISNEYGNAVCTDADGNAYITGTFQGSSITFGSYVLHNTNAGTLDIFVVKYDANGNVLWAKSGGGTNRDLPYGICTDSRGNVCVTGYFQSSSLSFGGITHINGSDNPGERDIFIVKYDTNGNLQWSKSFVGNRDDFSYSICSDADSNIYITGSFGYGNSILVFETDTLRNSGQYDAYIAKLNASGNLLWVKKANSLGWDEGIAICTDRNNNVYVTGLFQGYLTFGGDTILGSQDNAVLITKYDALGNELWIKGANGVLNFIVNVGNSISADKSGNVYITGSYQYSVIFGSDTLGNNGNPSVFVAKYDTNGNALWGRSPGGTNADYGKSISTDETGNAFITGHFNSSFLNFGGIPVLNSNVGYADIFVAEYDPNGNALWATSVGGQDADYGTGIYTGKGGDVYVSGYLGSYTLDFGNTTITNNGSYDAFLAKLNTDSISTGIEKNSSIACTTFPNPFSTQLTFTFADNLPTTVLLYDFLGQQVLRQTFTNSATINTAQLADGIYFYELRSDKGTLKTGKLAKQ